MKKENNHRMTKAPEMGLLSKSLMFHDYYGGESGIRTRGGREPSSVFKTGALNQLDHLSVRALFYTIPTQSSSLKSAPASTIAKG